MDGWRRLGSVKCLAEARKRLLFLSVQKITDFIHVTVGDLVSA